MPSLSLFSSTNRLIDLQTPPCGGLLVAEKVIGTETLGRMFEYEIFALSENTNLIDFEKLLGKHVTLTFEVGDGSHRYVDGRVAQVGLVGMVDNLVRYRLVARPWTWMLTRTADCKIFQEMDIKAILEEVFADQPDADYDVTSLTGKYQKRDYCVQYRETDFNFVSRLMEEEGIYYYFRHEKGKHTLVLCDAVGAHKSIGVLPFLPSGKSPIKGLDYVREWSVSQEIKTGVTALRDYNFETPNVDLLVKLALAPSYAESEHEVFDYPGEYCTLAQGDGVVKKRLEEFQVSNEVIVGSGDTRKMSCGSTFNLSGFMLDVHNREYLVVSTRIEANNNPFETGSSNAATYRCQFELISADVQYRTPRTTPVPVVKGLQTAEVVGPAGEEIFVDKYGRVKVQFHWDRYGQKDEKSSCWVRVSQIWAGKNYGWMSIPRIGQEVVVDFLEGNPDAPLITGRVYNAEQMPPWALPANKTQSGLLTRSSAGGSPENANHLKFEDKKGDELIDIHAEKNMSTHVENDDSTFVGHDQSLVVKRDQSIIIQRDSTEVVTRDRSVQVKNNESHVVSVDQKLNVVGNQNIKIDANHNTTVGGTFERTVTGNVTTITDASRKDVVKGNDDHKVNGNLTTSADGTVTLSSGVAIVLAAPHIEEHVSGANSKIIGVPSGPLKMMAAKIQSISGGDIDLLATGNINMVSMESNTTVLGGNSSGYIGMASETMVGLARSTSLSLGIESVVGAALTNKLAVEMENVLAAKITTAAGPDVEMRTMKTISPGGGGGGAGAFTPGQMAAAVLGTVAGVVIGAKSFAAGFGEMSDQYAAAQQQLQDAARDAEAAGFPGLATRLSRLAGSGKFTAAWVGGGVGTGVNAVANATAIAATGGLASIPLAVPSAPAPPETTYEQRRDADAGDSIGPEPHPTGPHTHGSGGTGGGNPGGGTPV